MHIFIIWKLQHTTIHESGSNPIFPSSVGVNDSIDGVNDSIDGGNDIADRRLDKRLDERLDTRVVDGVDDRVDDCLNNGVDDCADVTVSTRVNANFSVGGVAVPNFGDWLQRYEQKKKNKNSKHSETKNIK